MTATDPTTLDPEEIRKLPVQRDLPYNGLTREQVIAIGGDPDEVETMRASQGEWAEQRRVATEADAVLAAQRLVESGELLAADAAEALRAGGFHDAHAAFVQEWRAEEGLVAAIDALADRSFYNAEQYAEFASTRDAQERARLVQDAEATRQQLQMAQAEELQNDITAFAESTPGAHQILPAVQQQLVSDMKAKLEAGGELPSTPEERQAAIESAVKRVAILGDAWESIRQQAEAEWRIRRKQEAVREVGVVTEVSLARAKAQYIEGRTQQLADEKMIDLESLKSSPTAEDQTAALAEKYRGQQARSTDYHTQVAEIEKRGNDATARQDRGEGITAERARYREALERAEARAHYGTVKTSLDETATPEATKTGYGPDGSWPDELGPAI